MRALPDIAAAVALLAAVLLSAAPAAAGPAGPTVGSAPPPEPGAATAGGERPAAPDRPVVRDPSAAQDRPAAASAAPDDPTPHSEASLVAEPEWIRPGERFTVALRIRLDEGWHTYWRNPGDSGTPASLDWNLPEGFEADSIRWPRPYRIPYPPLLSYAYEEEVWLPVRITPPADLAAGSEVRLAARADWLVCEETCLPAGDSVAATLSVRDASPPPAERWQADFRELRRSLPRPADGWRFRAAERPDTLVLAVTPPASWEGGLEGVYFFAGGGAVVEHLREHEVAWHGEQARIRLPKSPYLASVPDTLEGVLAAPEGRAWDGAGHDALRVRAPVVDSLPALAARPGPSGFAGRPVADAGGDPAEGGSGRAGLLLLVTFAFLGGVLLNLMPCVFPVVSLKILGFAERSGGDRRTMRRHGLAFGAGVVLSFLALAGVLMAVRAAGAEVGWGFQLQSPLVVALLAALMFVIGLNFLGVFEVGTGLTRLAGIAADDERLRGSFLTGVLATVVASPCTAPFMGTAVGAALLGPPGQAPLVFGTMGAGMAAPYVALSTWPDLLERLPEPGRWMESLRQLLAFPMFAAALWLVWVFALQTGVGGAVRLLGAFLLVAFAVWLLSRWRGGEGRRAVRLAARATAAAGLLAAAVLLAVAAGAAPAEAPAGTAAAGGSGTAGDEVAWEEWSEEKVERYRREGRPVFVDFTAAWCITCQVNERTVLASDAVTSAFRERDVAALKADWTRRDPDITRALESFGRSGVPLYVVYPPDPGAEPRVLPTVLTREVVLEALPDAPSEAAAAGDGAPASAPAQPPRDTASTTAAASRTGR